MITLKAYCDKVGIYYSGDDQLCRWGYELSAKAAFKGIRLGVEDDEEYGSVNTYPEGYLDDFFVDVTINLE